MAKSLLLVVSVACACAFVHAQGETVETLLGKVSGTVETSRDGRDYLAWKGIPYAQAPVGGLRFQSPKPALKWSGVHNGSAYGPICAQMSLFAKIGMGEEDCLHASVFTPKVKFEEAKTGKGLPAMVWIHGGYFTSGSGNEYIPRFFMDEDVVLVTINYRLGALGFLSTQDKNARGNMGLKDQAMALQWIKANIKAFGGDPENITPFGQSSGSACVHFQMLNPKNRGIVKRGISQSGVANAPFALYEDPVRQAKIYAQNVGCPGDNTNAMVNCLKSKDVKELLEAHRPITAYTRVKYNVFVPVIEKIQDADAFITKTPQEVYASGEALNVPWLTGFNTDDSLFFAHEFVMNQTNIETGKKDFNMLERALFVIEKHDPAVTAKIRQFYFGNTDTPVDMSNKDLSKKMTGASSDRVFHVPVHDAVQMHTAAGPVYPFIYGKRAISALALLELFKGTYEFGKWPKEEIERIVGNFVLRTPDNPDMGVAHGDDLFTLFELGPLFKIEKNSPYYDFSKKLVKSWAQFASGKHPEIDGVKFPESKNKNDIKYMQLDSNTPKAVSYPRLELYNFWKGLNLKY